MQTAKMGASLLHAFAQVPDPRGARGRRHPLAAILALAVAAMLADARSLYAIAQWGRLQSGETVRALGFTREKTPTVSTLHEVFKALDVGEFEAALAQWAHAALAPSSRAIALDGKALRGIHGEELPGVRLVAAYDVETGLVLVQQGGQDQRTQRADPGHPQ
ncbi:MAG: transposase family protein [Ktedonobacterales bacterium]